MTYRPAAVAAIAAAASDNDIGAGAGVAKKVAINEDMLRIQVSVFMKMNASMICGSCDVFRLRFMVQ